MRLNVVVTENMKHDMDKKREGEGTNQSLFVSVDDPVSLAWSISTARWDWETDNWKAQRLTHTVIWYMDYLRSRGTRSLWRTRSQRMWSTSRRPTIPSWRPNRTLGREGRRWCSRRDRRRRRSWRARRSFKKRGSGWGSKFWRNFRVRWCAMGLFASVGNYDLITMGLKDLHYPANLMSQGLLWPWRLETLGKW